MDLGRKITPGVKKVSNLTHLYGKTVQNGEHRAFVLAVDLKIERVMRISNFLKNDHWHNGGPIFGLRAKLDSKTVQKRENSTKKNQSYLVRVSERPGCF